MIKEIKINVWNMMLEESKRAMLSKGDFVYIVHKAGKRVLVE
jgi:hypothetical protein